MCLSHLIYTVQPCLIHTCHTTPTPYSDHAVLLKATAQHGRRETAVLCRGLEKNGMVGAWHGHDMASVNHTRPHCVNQMGKTHSKALTVLHGRGTAWARHGNGMLCVNRPLVSRNVGSDVTCPTEHFYYSINTVFCDVHVKKIFVALICCKSCD